ncbi:MAG: N-acetyltransferase [Patescibacteria group bacterium]
MNMKLKEATKEDLKAILNFEKEAASQTFHAMITEQEIKEFLIQNKVFFINYESKNVGLIGYEPKEDSNYISELIVSSDYQSKGIATNAVKELLKTIGDKPSELHTHPENNSAIIVYLKSGFKIKGWKDNYYGDGEPRLILFKEKNDN